MFKEEIRGEEYYCLNEKEMQDVFTLKKIAEELQKERWMIMGIYSPLEVYPSIFDEIDLSSCETCTFDCDVKGYCKEEDDPKWISIKILMQF